MIKIHKTWDSISKLSVFPVSVQQNSFAKILNKIQT